MGKKTQSNVDLKDKGEVSEHEDPMNWIIDRVMRS